MGGGGWGGSVGPVWMGGSVGPEPMCRFAGFSEVGVGDVPVLHSFAQVQGGPWEVSPELTRRGLDLETVSNRQADQRFKLCCVSFVFV